MAQETICGIYKITSPSNKIYIGQTIDMSRRFRHYNSIEKIKRQPRLYNSFLKYGVKYHVFELLEVCFDYELNDLEIYYINKYNSCGINGLNCMSGGKSNGRHSAISKKKISASSKNMWKNEKTRISLIKKTKARWGDEKFKAKASKSIRRGINTPSSITKRRENGKKMWENKQYRATMTEILRKSRATDKVRKFVSNQAKLLWLSGKMNSKLKAVVQYNEFGKKINTFISASEAQRKTGIWKTHILDICHERRNCKMAGGFGWKFKNSKHKKRY